MTASQLEDVVRSRAPGEKEGGLLEVQRLAKLFPVRSGLVARVTRKPPLFVHAVDGVDLAISKNETLAVVGESGSGKTTLGLAILRLVEPTSGKVLFDGNSVTELGEKDLRKLRRNMQIVFQDPSSSLDPRKRVRAIIGEPLRAHMSLSKDDETRMIEDVLKLVGLSPKHINNFPHQFSGGQRQRISIARAIILNPRLMVLDEPTSQLDASVQAQILLLLANLQKQFGLSYLLITHNMSVARYLADKIAVMYLGKIVESGTNDDIALHPLHPYTRLLISSVLEPDPKKRLKDSGEEEGEMPSAINPPAGCRFNTKCPYAKQRCFEEEPNLRNLGDPGHVVACHYAEQIAVS